jgi:hypothetical protein
MKKCSIGLDTRVKDKRNIIANFGHFLDQQKNVQYTKEDDIKKCEIFNIEKSNIDFISLKHMTGVGDHYYPLCKYLKKNNRIGSDSFWNRIPVSGNNTNYTDVSENMYKINKWLKYCEERDAKLFWDISEKQRNIIDDGFKKMEALNHAIFEELKRTII